MKSTDFCYWLQGFFEISEVEHLTAKQIQMVKNHLNLVFKHEIDPSYGDEAVQAVLNTIHGPTNMPFSGDNSGRDQLVRC